MKFDTQELCGSDKGRGFNMTTATGKPFWPADPRPEDIRIKDIARHLSRICRFNGALKESMFIEPSRTPAKAIVLGSNYTKGVEIVVEIYSVAQHSVLVCDHVEDPTLKLPALLHDAAEAYCGDMTKPLKSLHPGRRMIEQRIERAIEERFVLPKDIMKSPVIKEQDYRAVLTEHRDLQENQGVDWGLEQAKAEPWPERIVPLLPSAAYRLFMDRFNQLYKGE